MEILVYGFPAAAIVIGLTQICKKFVADRFIPVISVVLGIILVALGTFPIFTAKTVVVGIVVGLVASGLWSGTKKTILNK